MDCCDSSPGRAARRAGIIAATPLTAEPESGAGYASPADVPAGALVVQDLETVTVTDTSVVITWFSGSAAQVDRYGRPAPVATDTEVLLGDPMNPDSYTLAFRDETPTPYHYAEITGLEPGRLYGYIARSDGQAAVPSSLNFPGTLGSLDAPGWFTTLTPPPGRHVLTIALANDVHYGESLSGVVVADYPPGVEQEPGLPPYPEVMLAALLGDLGAADRGADRLIVAGDLTAAAGAADVTSVRKALDGFGALGADYFVSRGNHDRPHSGTDYATCTVVPGASEHHDCWAEAFPYPWQTLQTYDVGGLRIVGLDTTTLDHPGGTIGAEQLSELSRLLRQEPDRPTLVYGHHPVTVEAAVTTAAGPGFDLDQGVARELEGLYATAQGVFLHHSGHTHRNKRTRALSGPDTEFLEVAATKEYPGGYSLLRIYTGGYMVNFYKTRTDLAREWSQRTRAEYFGLFPAYTFGTIADRNHTVVRDLSGLTRPEGHRAGSPE